MGVVVGGGGLGRWGSDVEVCLSNPTSWDVYKQFSQKRLEFLALFCANSTLYENTQGLCMQLHDLKGKLS